MTTNFSGIPTSGKIETSNHKISENILSTEVVKIGPTVHPIFENISIMNEEESEEKAFFYDVKIDEKEMKLHSKLDAKQDGNIFAKIWSNEEVASNFESNLIAKSLANLFNDSSLSSIHQKSRLPFGAITEWLLEFLKEEKTEGVSELQSLLEQFQVFSSSIQELKSKVAEAKTSLEKASLVQELSDKTAKKVEALEIGKSSLIEGQWLDKDSGLTKHVIYQFIRTEKDKYEIKVFNNNPEAVRYQMALEGESKNFIRPLIHYQGIPSVELFCNDDGVIRSDFFQALIQPSLLDKGYSSSFIFEKVFTFFHKYRINPNQETVGFVTAKTDYATSWNALQTVLFSHMKKNDYKKLVWKIRKEALIAGYQCSKKSLEEPWAEEMRTLLKNCAHALIRSTTRRYQDSFIDSVEAKEARTTAQQLLNRLETIENDLSSKQKIVKKWDVSSIESISHEEPLKKVMGELTKPSTVDTSPITIKNTPVLAPFTLPEDPKKLLNALREIKLDSGNALNNALQIESIVNVFPIPVVGKDGYWDKISKYDVDNLISCLGNMVNLYQSAIVESSSQPTLPIYGLTSRSLYVILHRLALSKEKEKYTGLAEYPLFFNGSYQDQNPFYFHCDKQSIERDQQLRHYFKDFEKQAKQKPLFNFSGLDKDFDECGDLSYYRKHPDISWNYPNKTFLEEQSEYSSRDDFKKLSDNGLIQVELLIDMGKGRLPKELQALKRAAYLDYTMANKQTLWSISSNSNTFFSIKWYVRNIFGNISFGLGISVRPSSPSTPLLMPKISEEATTLFVKNSRFVKDRDENTILSNKDLLNDKYESFFPQQLFLNESKSELKPRQLLLHYKKQLSIFGKPEQQTLFELLLFRSIINNKSEQSFSLVDQLQESSLCHQYETFIKDGLEQFSTFQPNERVHVYGALFFIRLANRLHRLNPDRFQLAKEHIALLQEWLKIKDLTVEERSAIHLQLIHQYRGLPQDKIDDEMISQICRSWFLYQNDPITTEWKYPLMEREAQAFVVQVLSDSCSWRTIYSEVKELTSSCALYKQNIHQLNSVINTANYRIEDYERDKQYYRSRGVGANDAVYQKAQAEETKKKYEDYLVKDQEKLKTLSISLEEKKADSVSIMKKRAGGILVDLGLVSSTDAYKLEVVSPGVLKLSYDDNNAWEIHLPTGKVYNLLGAVTKLRDKPTLQGHFPWLLQDAHSFYQSGNSTLFKSEKYGSIQVVPIKIDKIIKDREVQRQVDDSWFKYSSVDTLDVKGMPRSLLHGRTAWTSLHKMENFNGESIESGYVTILTSSSGKNEFLITEKGTIHPIDPETDKPNTKAYISSYTHEKTEFDLSLMEDSQYIVVESDGDKKPQKMHLVRYGITLNIVEDKEVKKAFWADKHDYFIALDQPKGLLGSVPNYLVLQHKDNIKKQKVLIPCQQKLNRKSSLSRLVSLQTKVTPENFGVRVDHSQFFVECDLKGDVLASYTAESNLYLAYLYIAQKEYEKAFALINKIGEAESLSKHALSIMGWIVAFPKKTDDPTAIAFSLRVAAMQQRHYQNNRRQDKSLRPLDSSRLMGLLHHYCRSINNIPASCELTYDDEMLLIDYIESAAKDTLEKAPDLTWVSNRKMFLQKKDYFLNQKMLSNVNEYIGEVGGYIPKKSALTLPYPETGLSLWENEKLIVEKVRRCEANIVEAENATSFLPNDKSKEKDTYRVPRLLNESLDSLERKNFWYEAYLILKNNNKDDATNKAERKQLALRLELMSEIDIETNEMKYLHALFDFRSKIPETSNFSDIESRWKFVKELHSNLTNNHQEDVYSKDNLLNREKLDKRKYAFKPSNNNLEKLLVTGPIPFKKAPLPKRVQKRQEELVFAPVKSDQQNFLESLFSDYLIETPPKEKKDLDSSEIEWTDIKISKDYKGFKEVLEREFGEFNDEYKKGIERNNSPTYTLQSQEKDAPLLSKQLGEKRKKLDSDRQEMEKNILLLANSKNVDKKSREQELLFREAKYKPDLTIPDLVMLFSQRRKDGFINANSNLDNKDLNKKLSESVGGDTTAVDLLYSMIGQYMELAVYDKHLSEIEENALKLEAMDKDNPDRDETVRLIGSGLKYKQPYKGVGRPEYLLFEYCSGKRLRPEQAKLLDALLKKDLDGKFKNMVGQMMMGGGKTSVIAFIKLLLAIQPGRIALYVVPDAQFETLKTNLGRNLKELVNQTLVAIDYPPHDLFEPEVLLEIQIKLQQAMERGAVVMMKPHVLEFLWAILKKEVCESSEGKTIDPLKETLINALVGNTCLFANNTDGLIDEVDTILSLTKEVIIPSGTPKKIDPKRIRLVTTIFSLMMKEFRKETGLDTNKQTLLSPQVLKNMIAPAIAKHLAKDYRALKLSGRPDLHGSFERYVSGTMPNKIQLYLDHPEKAKETYGELKAEEDLLDLEFLKYRQQLKVGKEDEVEAFHQTALCRHLFTKLFQETFNREGGRHFGESNKKGEEDKIVPFKAVGIPDVTEFGYHYEALVLYLMHGLQFKIKAAKFERFIKKKHDEATKQAQKNKCSFENTGVAKAFKELTGGISLSTVEDLNEREKARQYVNQNFDSLLTVQSEFAQETITYYSNSYTANGLSLVGLLNTVQAFSGTLSNYETFHEKLSHSVILDQGIKGQILSKVIERAEKNEFQVNVVKSPVLEEFLAEILKKHPKKNDVRGLFDAAGSLKDLTNNEVVYRLWDFFHPKKEKAPVDWTVKSIFTFYQFSENSDPAPAILTEKNGKLEIIELGGTTKECFEEKGIDLNETFFFINEKGCVGTDLPLPKGMIFQMTANSTQTVDMVCQAYLRARDFFNTQNVESIISEEVLVKIGVDKDAIQSIINQGIINQAIQLSKEIYKSVPLKIDQIFEWNILYAFLIEPYSKNGKITSEDIKAVGKFSSFLQTVREDDVGNQYGRLEMEVNSREVLEKYADLKLTEFKKCSPPENVLEGVEKLLKELFSHLSKKLPKTVLQSSDSKPDNQGIQNQMLQTTQKTTTEVQKTDIQQDQNVEQELKRYQNVNSGTPKTEEPWNDEMIASFLSSAVGQKESLNKHLNLKKSLVKGERGTAIVSFNDMFSKDKRGFNFTYDKPYEKIFFNGPYYATENFIHTHQQQLPFFHRIQRPPQQILVVKGHRRNSFFYLSKDEAVAFKAYLDKKGPKAVQGVWLIQHDGSTLLADDDSPKIDLDAPSIKKGLLVANILNRNMSYLESHREETVKWLNTPCGLLSLDESYKLKTQFVKLTMAQNKEEYALLSQSKIFYKESSLDISRKMGKLRGKGNEGDKKLSALSYKEIASLGERDQKLIEQLDVDQVNYLDPSSVKYLLPQQIELLNESKLIQAVPKELFPHLQEYQMYYINEKQLPWIHPSDGGHIEALPKQLMVQLDDDQFRNISIDQIESLTEEKDIARLDDGQLVFLLPKQIQSIIDPKLIQRVPLELVQHLTKGQVPHIKESQLEGLQPAQTAYVIDDFVEKLPTRLVPYITAKQVERILEGQVQYLTSPETINAVSLEWLHHVPKGLRRQHLSKDKVSEITKDILQTTPKVKLQVVQELSAEQFADYYMHWISERNIDHLWTRQQIVELHSLRDDKWKWKRQDVSLHQPHHSLTRDADQDERIRSTYNYGFEDNRYKPRDEYRKGMEERLREKIKIRKDLIEYLQSLDGKKQTKGVNSSIPILERQIKSIENVIKEFAKVNCGNDKDTNKQDYYIDSKKFQSLLDDMNDDSPIKKEEHVEGAFEKVANIISNVLFKPVVKEETKTEVNVEEKKQLPITTNTKIEEKKELLDEVVDKKVIETEVKVEEKKLPLVEKIEEKKTIPENKVEEKKEPLVEAVNEKMIEDISKIEEIKSPPIQETATIWNRLSNYWSNAGRVKKVMTVVAAGSMLSIGAASVALFGWLSVASVVVPIIGVISLIYWFRNWKRV